MSGSIEELPPSAKLVYKVLEYAEHPLTQDEIADETRLSRSTLQYALDRLEKVDAIQSDHDLQDLRKKVYKTDK
ncbi:MarR family transcriptional regulator [Natrinema halophilum]|uniref:MarR family transcriptional regulator n=1 Tax=Natrinema halophilum TaxID=1699371 RepID=UPI001F30F12A|nr:MarR family transcriptional regulator [Natrinema halophilum]UHQ96407.1 MarR family transcriptional regulator [Natrinema halophilum]